MAQVSFSQFTVSHTQNFSIFHLSPLNFSFFFFLLQKLVLKVLTMTDDKTKQKAIEAAADIYGIFFEYYQ